MENKVRKTFVYIGRFQPFHRGHRSVIYEALRFIDVEDLLILVGSSNTKDERNPFSYDQRKNFIKDCYYRTNLNILPLPDIIDNDDEWLNQIIDIVKYKNNVNGVGFNDLIFISGTTKDFYECQNKYPKIVLCDRSKNNYSGTRIRKYLNNTMFYPNIDKNLSNFINEHAKEIESLGIGECTFWKYFLTYKNNINQTNTLTFLQ